MAFVYWKHRRILIDYCSRRLITKFFSLTCSAMLCCFIALILFRIRIRFSRADSELALVITGLVRVSTLGDAVVSCLITLGDDATLLSFDLVHVACRGRLLFGKLVELRKILANCFKDTAVSLVSFDTGGMPFSRALFNLRDASRFYSLGVFRGVLILCRKNHTDLTILSTLVLGT